MKRSSILDNLSFNSYAVEEDNENRTYVVFKIMMLGAKCTFVLKQPLGSRAYLKYIRMRKSQTTKNKRQSM